MSRRKPYIIGLTGNIATGKSSVAQMLASLGAHVIDADAVAHEVMRAGTPTWREIVNLFGLEILCSDGEIDRGKLGAIVFADAEALRRLERIVHPVVIAHVNRQIEEIVQQASEGDKAPLIAVEAIKLIEAGMHADYDALWVVTCDPAQQKARLMARGGLTEAAVTQRIEAQPPASAKVALADVVIDNSGSLQDTRRQVEQAWQAVQSRLLDKKP